MVDGELSKAVGALGAGLEQRVSFNFLGQLCDVNRLEASAATDRVSDSLFCHKSAHPSPGEELAQLREVSSRLVMKVMP